jgi:histone H3/H4
MENILRRAGADRVSHEAKEELRKEVESYADDLAKLALTFTKHASRKTVKAEDVKSASDL